MTTLTVDLEPDQERRIQELADERGLSLSAYMLQAALQAFGSPASTDSGTNPASASLGTGAELLEKWRANGFMSRSNMTESSVDYVNRTRALAERRELP